MGREREGFIRRKLTKLKRKTTLNVEVLDKLWQSEVLTKSERDTIESKSTNHERTSIFYVQILPKKSPDTYKKTIDAFRSCGLESAVKIMEELYGEGLETEVDKFVINSDIFDEESNNSNEKSYISRFLKGPKLIIIVVLLVAIVIISICIPLLLKNEKQIQNIESDAMKISSTTKSVSSSEINKNATKLQVTSVYPKYKYKYKYNQINP